MILEALVRQYERLTSDPDSGIAAYGYSLQKIGFCVVLNPDGSLHAIEALTDTSSGQPKPINLLVPHFGVKRTRQDKPFFCWDKAEYIFGTAINPDDDRRAAERLKLFIDLHTKQREKINSPYFNAIVKFLSQIVPSEARRRDDWNDIKAANFVFQIRGTNRFIHDLPEVRAAWRDILEDASTGERRKCLVSGKTENIARLHPAIKGVKDRPGQPSEKGIVAFNSTENPAFDSRELKQSVNAPVSEQAAFQYATALNALLADSKHHVQLGDTTVVFWTDQPDTGADAALAEALGQWAPSGDEEAGKTRSRLRDFLNRFRQATADPTAGDLERADAPFYVLGLSPNAARISVRFWMRCTVAELAERLGAHAHRLQVVGLNEMRTPSLKQLTRSTAREAKEVKPNLAGELTRAFLHNLPLPRSFLNALLQRVRVEGEVTAVRAAGLKAYLLSHGNEIMDIYLNREHPSVAYHAGRVFATLAFAQEKALGSINAGVVKKNLASAMATPGLTLGRLQRAAEVGHMHKLDANLAEFVRDELTSANCRLLDGPPNNLGPDDQTRFALGFYQQTAYLRVVGNQVDGKKRHRSDLGEWMRSKLEVRVANLMNKARISYIYEPSAILPNAGERWPDFVLRRGGDPANDVYIEVAGYPGDDYDKRHRLKLDAYRKLDITQEGGTGGKLVVLDYRERDYDDKSVLDALNFLINDDTDTPPEEN